jgi:hypothetical protein
MRFVVMLGQIGSGGAVAYNARIGGFGFGVATAGLVALVRRPGAEHTNEARDIKPPARADAPAARPIAPVAARPISPPAAAPIIVAGLTRPAELPIVRTPGADEPKLLS